MVTAPNGHVWKGEQQLGGFMREGSEVVRLERVGMSMLSVFDASVQEFSCEKKYH
jgi:hypothetical protein